MAGILIRHTFPLQQSEDSSPIPLPLVLANLISSLAAWQNETRSEVSFSLNLVASKFPRVLQVRHS